MALVLALLPLLQAGDVPGEPQPDPPAELVVPAAPVRTPDEERATFALADGLVIELVAAEPLVRDPVQAVFAADGRLFVCEMRGYMPDVDGRGEDAPVGEIAVLTDEDGDGRMDRRTTFLDGLVLPRAVAPCEDGALVIAPPELLFCRDTDGDGRADEREVVATGLEGVTSPEHAINALDWGIDNAYRCANAPLAFRRVDGRWAGLPTAGGGQWGLAQDELGRAYFDTNFDPLRGDLFPSRYACRNPNLGIAAGANVRLADDFRTFPARVTPGVNRGYRDGTLRADFTLATVTAACAPHLFRGDGLPAAYRDQAFVCEPSGNLVLRYALEADGLALRARRADPDGRDFLTSTDERFRPVNLASGPDGALYVVDMYRGVIQHRLFVTSYLRRQVEARGLAQPIGLGRIWRVRAAGERRSAPALPAHAGSDEELVALLGHPNGWTRDAARRVLLEDGATSALLARLRERVAGPGDRAARLQALSALEELSDVDAELALALLADADVEVRAATLRAVERRLGADPRLLARAVELGREPDARLAHQVLLSLGELGAAGDAGMAALLAHDCAGELRVQAALSGLGGRELEFLAALVADEAWRADAEGRARLFDGLAACIVRDGRRDRRTRLIELVATAPESWQRRALAAGASRALPPRTADAPAPIPLDGEPAGFARLAADPDLAGLAHALSWPGHPAEGETQPRALTADEARSFDHGRELFARSCTTCHLASGQGEPGKAPSLRGSPRVLGEPERLVALLLHGLRGPVPGFSAGASAEMPALVASDEELAALATYLRREWDHGADPVTAEAAARARAATTDRARPWTLEELARVPLAPR